MLRGEETIVIDSDGSDGSVVEIEPPKKKTPPIVDIVEDDIVINVNKNINKRDRTDNVPLKLLESSKDSVHNVRNPFHNNDEIVEADNPSHWTPDMIKFYNDDWGGEESFIVEKLQEKMDKCPSLWTVAQRDLYYMKNRRSRSSLKCFNCCQFGHPTNQCMEPIRTQKCHMCGEAGHGRRNCPNSICLNCGNHTRKFVRWCHVCANESKVQCSRCLLWGHHFINCSDNWRRFHSTIGKPQVSIPQESPYKDSTELWCCNCGTKGHHQIHCFIQKDDLYMPDTFPFVSSYETSFNSELPTSSNTGGYYNKISKMNSSRLPHGKASFANNKRKDFNFSLHFSKHVNKKKKSRKRKKKQRDKLVLFQI